MGRALGMRDHGFGALGMAACLLAGCASGAPAVSDRWDESPAWTSDAGAGAPLPDGSRWTLPPATRAAGEAVFVPYTPAGPWDGGEHCAPALSSGVRALGDALYDSHGPDLRLGGFACEPSPSDPSLMSMRGTGRSLDITPTGDPALGDVIANYLVEHAGELGVQLVAWNGTRWNGSYTGEKDAPILGGSTYRDHVHAELTPEAAGAAGPVDATDGGVASGGADGGWGGVDAGPSDAGPLAPCAGFRAVGYDVCVEDAGRCEIIFRDGAGCTVACARVAMRCADSWNDLDGACAPSPSEHAGCGSTGHTSDYCTCVAR